MLTKSSKYLDAQITVPEVAAILGVSSQVVRTILDKGLIPYTVPSKHRRIRRGDVLAYQASTREGGVPELASTGEENVLAD